MTTTTISPPHAAPRPYRVARPIRAVVVAASVGAGCGQPATSPEDAWLLNTLAADNRHLLERAPDLVAEKFAKMAIDPHQYLRGTNAIFLREARTGAGGFPISVFATPEVSDVLLVGDAHLENFGTFRDADGSLVVEVNDFDASTYGAFHLDVWRLGLSLDVALAMLDASPEARRFVVGAVADGYVDAVSTPTGGPRDAGTGVDAATAGRILGDLLRRAASDGAAAEELDDYTTPTPDGRALRWGMRASPGPDFVVDALEPVGLKEQRLVDEILARWPDSLVDAGTAPGAAARRRISPVARRLGAGIGSYPLLRYYVVLEGPTSARRDDWLLEVKEAPAAPALPAALPGAERRFPDNGARVVVAQRALQGGPARDPLLGHATAGPMSFRIRHRTKYQKGLEVMRLHEKRDEWSLTDLEVLATALGGLLGRAHARAPSGRGPAAGPAVAGVLRGRETGFVDEVVRVTAARGARLRAEHTRFVRLRETLGPMLGLP